MQILVEGTISGLPIAVLAVAFTCVYLPTRVFHLAMAGVYSAVLHATWLADRAGLPWYVACGAGLGAGVLLSVLCECLNHARLDRIGAPPGAHLIASLGINVVLMQAIALAWGNEPKALRTETSSIVQLGAISIAHPQLLTLVITTATLTLFFVWLYGSRLGISHGRQLGLLLRALSDNDRQLALLGQDTRRLRRTAFGLCGLLTAVAALATAYDLPFTPYGGFSALLLAIVAAVVGGMRTFFGPAIGGVIVGILRAEAVWYLSARWQEAVSFLLLAGFLVLWPGGLTGSKGRLEGQT